MLRTMVYLTAWLAFLIAALGLAARFAPVVNHAVLLLAALAPYLMIGAGVSALLLAATRQWWAAGASLILTVAVLAVQAPAFVGSSRPGETMLPVRMVTANLREGTADPAALIEIAEANADVLVVQELTPELAAAVKGLETEFPYSALDARSGANGVGIWSRYPITQSNRDPSYQLGMVTAAVRPPGSESDVVVLAAHVVGPWPQPIDGWRAEMAKMPATLRATAGRAGSGAVIVAGDFNATTDMKPFRELLRNGFRDAAEQAGSGLIRTFPADSAVPPLIGIDHVLTRNASATNVSTVRIPGSDHLGLIATVFVPGRQG